MRNPINHDNTSFATAVGADIAQMESSLWVDHQTALVSVEISVWNPNNNLIVALMYPIQFTNSGQVIAHSPLASASQVDLSRYGLTYTVFLPIVYVSYYLTREVWVAVIGVYSWLCLAVPRACSVGKLSLFQGFWMGQLNGLGGDSISTLNGVLSLRTQRVSNKVRFCARRVATSS